MEKKNTKMISKTKENTLKSAILATERRKGREM